LIHFYKRWHGVGSEKMMEPSLDTLPLEVFLYILKFVTVDDQKTLRLVSVGTKFKVDSQLGRSPFKFWKLHKRLTALRLCQFSDEVSEVRGVDLGIEDVESTDELKRSVQTLSTQHSEFDELRLTVKLAYSNDEMKRYLLEIVKITSDKLVNLTVVDSNINIVSDMINASAGNIKEIYLTGKVGSLFIKEGKLQKLCVLHVELSEKDYHHPVTTLINSSGGNITEMTINNMNGEWGKLDQRMLQHLRVLNLGSCRDLKDLVLYQLINAANRSLEELYLPSTVSLVAVDEIRLPKLKVLHLIDCDNHNDVELSYFLCVGLSKMINSSSGNIVELHLTMANISGDWMEIDEGKLQNLRILQLTGCRDLKEDGLSIINASGGNISKLCLTDTYVSGDLTEIHLGKLQSLRELNLHSSSVTDEGLSEVINASGGKLEKLCLTKTYISGAAVSIDKGKLENLKMLQLTGCKNLSYGGQCRIINASGGCIVRLYLSLSDTSAAAEEVSESKLQYTRILKLNSDILTNAGLSKIINATGGNVEELNFENTDISRELGNTEVDKLRNLSILKLTGCRNLTDDGLAKISNATVGRNLRLVLKNTCISERFIEDSRKRFQHIIIEGSAYPES